MLLCLRLALLLLLLCSLLIGGSILHGMSHETMAYATYRLRDDGRPVIHVVDPLHQARHDLMETQCFEGIPYESLRLILSGGSAGPIWLIRYDALHALIRQLRCS